MWSLHTLLWAASPAAQPVDATSVDAFLLSAQSHHHANRPDEALDALRSACQLAPSATVASFELGNILLARLQASEGDSQAAQDEQAAEAEDAFRAALGPPKSATPPHHRAPIGMAYNNLANLLSLTRRYTEAEGLLRTGLRVQPVAYQYNGLASLLLRKAQTASVAADSADDETAARGSNRTALLVESASLLRLALGHEAEASEACGGTGPPPMEHAYRENLAHVLALLEADKGIGAHGTRPRAPGSAQTEGTAQAAGTAQGAGTARSRLPVAGARLASTAARKAGHPRPRLVLLVPPGGGCDEQVAASAFSSTEARTPADPLKLLEVDAAHDHPTSPPGALHTCGCPAPFGTLQDVAAAAAAMGALGYMVEVCACVPIVDVGVDENGTLWQPASAYAGDAATRGEHIVVHVDQPPARLSGVSGSGGQVLSRWLWQRLPDAAGTAPNALGVDGVLSAPNLTTWLDADGEDDLRKPSSASQPHMRMLQTRRNAWPTRVEATPPLLDAAFVTAGRASGPRSAGRFCYTQPPAVGLHALLSVWPRVRAARPKATLVILSCPSVHASDACEEAFRQASKDGSGVRVVEGELLGTALASALAGCAFDLIPVEHAPVVSLGSLLRAQAAGAVPVSTRHLDSLLPTGCGRWDLGPPPNRENVSRSQTLRRDWLAAVLGVGSRKLKEHREAMRAWASQQIDSQDAPTAWHGAFGDALLATPAPVAAAAAAAVEPAPVTAVAAEPALVAVASAPARKPSSLLPPATPGGHPPSKPPPAALPPKLERQPWRRSPIPAVVDEAARGVSASQPPTTKATASTAMQEEVARLNEHVAGAARALRDLRQHVTRLEARLTRCEERRLASGSGAESTEVGETTSDDDELSASGEYPPSPPRWPPAPPVPQAQALPSADASDADEADVAAADVGTVGHPRLCWLVLLDRPGGIDVALQAARRQSSSAFRMVLLDRLHAAREAAVSAALRDTPSLRGLATRVVHLPMPARSGGGAWSFRGVWSMAKETCEAGGLLETIVLARQHVWLPASFVASTLHFHAHIGRAALLGYPIWQFKAPGMELAPSALDNDAAVSVISSPPLKSAFSSRGWRLVRRLQPAPLAPLAGSDAMRIDGGGRSGNPAGFAGVWSFPARSVERIRDEGIPPTPGAPSELCFTGATIAPPKGLSLMLANLSMLCEALETEEWEPQTRWARDHVVDGGCLE